MDESAQTIPWTDIVGAIAAGLNVLLTVGLLAMAWCAWRAAKGTLSASQKAAGAAKESAEQARLSVLAMERDSRERTVQHEQATRPYVHARLVPSLLGPSSRAWDFIVENLGQSAAYDIRLKFSHAELSNDVINEANLRLADSGLMLAPTQRLRTIWFLPADDNAAPPEAQGAAHAVLTISYKSSTGKIYIDKPVTLDPSRLGMTPAPSSGPDAQDSPDKHVRNVVHALRQIALNVGEISR